MAALKMTQCALHFLPLVPTCRRNAQNHLVASVSTVRKRNMRQTLTPMLCYVEWPNDIKKGYTRVRMYHKMKVVHANDLCFKTVAISDFIFVIKKFCVLFEIKSLHLLVIEGVGLAFCMRCCWNERRSAQAWMQRATTESGERRMLFS